MSGPGPVDFVPDTLEAAALGGCLENREVKVATYNLASLAAPGLLGESLSGLAATQTRINEINDKIVVILVEAFVEAGCPPPVFPDNPTGPDVSECLTTLTGFATAMQDNTLGTAQGIITVTLDDNGTPIRIQA